MASQTHKHALRKTISGALRALSQSDIESQSHQIAERIIAAPWFHRARVLSCYLSMPSAEANTWTLVPSILRAGKTLYAPKIDPSASGRMDFLRIRDENDLERLESGLWGIREPRYLLPDGLRRENAMDATSPQLDVILVPGVAFDRAFSRLGHGKGYYDRFITAYTASKARPLLGIALREQMVALDRIPMDDHDWRMDVIVSPDEVVENQDIATTCQGG
ncbi:hypothetical protein OF83DRAFT_1178120 [Amylostereum chailletii]|nr:hypothetical protein OF83DRAFT_1178120 [Amylostereum chailletii]